MSEVKKKITLPAIVTKKQFHQAVGRRKRASASVRIWTANPQYSAKEGYFLINAKPVEEFFSNEELRLKVLQPLERVKSMEKFAVSVKVSGGGVTGQADAIRHGLARALVSFFPNFRKKLKRSSYLRRDPRKKERKKFGLKKARRAPQWSKR